MSRPGDAPSTRATGGLATAAPGSRAPRQRYVVLALGFCTVMATIGFTRFAYTLIMPAMRDGLDVAWTDMGLIGTVGFVAYLLVSLPLGAAVSRFGMRRSITAALLAAAAGLFGLALSTGLAVAVAANVVVQAASSAANAAAFAIVTPWFSARARGRATGVVLGGAGAGITLVGHLLPPVLSGPGGWRTAWAIVGAATLAVAVACAALLRDHPDARWSGAAGGAGGWTALLRMPVLWVLAGTGAMFGFEYIVFGQFFAVHVTARGHTIETAGRLWSLVGILTIASGLVGGALSDRIGRLPAIAFIFATHSLASLLLAWRADGLPLYLAVVLYGGTVMGHPAAMGALCGDLVGAARASAAIGVINVLFGTGQALGPVVGGMVLDATGSLSAVLVAAAAVSLVGGLGALLAIRTVPPGGGAASRPGLATRAAARRGNC
jgi:predicted MFS family arabinose efflux permease